MLRRGGLALFHLCGVGLQPGAFTGDLTDHILIVFLFRIELLPDAFPAKLQNRPAFSGEFLGSTAEFDGYFCIAVIFSAGTEKPRGNQL